MYTMAILNQEDDTGAVCSKETQGRVSSFKKVFSLKWLKEGFGK